MTTQSTRDMGDLFGRAGPYIPDSALALTGVSAFLSIVGACVIFYSYAKLVHLRNTVRMLLVCLSVADLLTASGNLAGTLRYKIKYDWDFSLNDTMEIAECMSVEVFCTGQSFVTTFSSMCSFFWTVAIAIFFYASVVMTKSPKHPRILLSFCHAVCWGVPAVITIAALASRALGEDLAISSGAWCWINDCMTRKLQLVWMVMSGKGWEILAYILSAALFLLLKYNLILERHRGRLPFQVVNAQRSTEAGRFRAEDEHFVFLPLVLYLLRMWGTIRFILAAIELNTGTHLIYPQKLQDFLLIMHCIGDSGQAFVNCLMFCVFDKRIRRALLRRKSEVQNEESDNETRPLITPVNNNLSQIDKPFDICKKNPCG